MKLALKSVIDVIFAVFCLVIFSPVMLLLSVIIVYKLGSPVLFKQQRPGKNGKIFTIYKFRTMKDSRDSKGNLLEDEYRLTGFGKFLRGSSLDELPELLNVLRGEMSLVGPRPLLVEYLGRYTPEQAKRHEMKPGITGWAQVNGRNAISWEEKFRLDVWYIDNWSFWLDIMILFMTVSKVFQREGISQTGHATAEKFMGYKEGRDDES